MYDPDKFHALLDGLVAQNRSLREAAEGWGIDPALPNVNWAEEWATVTCDIGRRAGKSEWIRRRATKDDLIVTLNQDMVRQSFTPKQTEATVLTAHTLQDRVRTKRFNTVYVDEPRYVFEVTNLDEFYATLALDRYVTFVFLGMR